MAVPLAASAAIYNDSSAGHPDGTAFSTWYGSDSVYVHTIYDHSTQANDFSETVQASQARIVNAGVFDGELVFDGVDDYYNAGTPVAIEEVDFTCYHRFARASTGIYSIGLAKSNTTRQATMLWWNDNTLYVCEGRMFKKTSQTTTGDATVTTQWQLAGFPEADGHDAIIRLNGSDLSAVQHATGAQTATLDVLGRANNSAYHSGGFTGLYYFNALHDAGEMADIESTVGI